MMEKFVLLPFAAAGCMSESSIAVRVGQQHAKRSKLDTKFEGREEEEEERQDKQDDDESLSDENLMMKSPSTLLALPKFQKLFKNFKNFSQALVYNKAEELEEAEMGIEIGFPTDVKHVTHIGLDGCASSILSKGWEHEPNQTIKIPPFPLSRAMAKNTTQNPTFRSLLEIK
ncbi:CRIB domain-containing protein ric4-like [Castilleja foliolosa]|uniref:CRIB domain-containing protein ric4-like n=1 Tax=Castilleja foliolosa TaxID=1961234 RepID=A0ABD3ECN5_9LAMI